MAGRPAERISCYVCDAKLLRKAMVKIAGDDNANKRHIAIARRADLNLPPQEFDATSRICFTCNVSINSELNDVANDPDCLRLNVLKQTRNSSCMFCNTSEYELRKLTSECRVNIFTLKNIYVPESSRCCQHHLNANGFVPRVLLEGLKFINRPYRISGKELQLFLQNLRESAMPGESFFDDYNHYTDEELVTMTSLTREEFETVYTYCDSVPEPGQNWKRHISKKDLMTFLCKFRQKLSDRFLKVIFKYESRQAVSLVISKVRKSLMGRFVPQNIGLGAMPRPTYFDAHVTEFSNRLYNSNPDSPVAIIIVDGTYVEIEKPTNTQAFRESFSTHKGYHLVKPVLLVAPDGYILDIHGPYFSDYFNNDAAILRNELEENASGFRDWLNDGDVLIVDRGYRDVLPFLDQIGIRYKMPPCLGATQRQLDTEEANEARLVTKSRWVVEAKNGHVKSVYKFLDGTISAHHAPFIGDYYKIAGALLNKFRKPIVMEGADKELAEKMLQISSLPNVVQARVEAENLGARRAQWVHLTENHAPTFPRLTLNYLKDLTVGVYQVNLAPAYIQDKVKRDGNEVFEFDELIREPNLIRVQVYSKHRRATKYQLYIAFVPDNSNQADTEDDENEGQIEPICGYYCTCKTGSRTLGSCAHVASVLWFLGFARHQPKVKYPTTKLLDKVADSAHRT